METPKAQRLKRLGKLRVRHIYFKAGDASVKSVVKMNDKSLQNGFRNLIFGGNVS